MANIQDYIIFPSESKTVVTPDVFAIGLPRSSSTYDSRANTLSTYALSKAVDGDLNSNFRWDNDGDGASGFIVDLREPEESVFNFNSNNISAFTTDAATPTITAKGNLNNDTDDFMGVTPANSNVQAAGFILDFDTNIYLNRFKFAVANTYTAGKDWNIQTSLDGITWQNTQELPSVTDEDTIYDIEIDYGAPAGVFDINRGYTQKGDLPPVRYIRIYARVSSTDQLQFSVFEPYQVAYNRPEGVYLSDIQAKLYGGNGIKTFNWEIDISSDGGTNYSNLTTITQPVGYPSSQPNKNYFLPTKNQITHFRLTQDGSTDGNQYDQRIYEIKYKHIPSPYIKADFDFNDSVLETKAWNSSRYDGRQLSAQKLNKISSDDIGNNNKTPIIRNYTRNIYIGNEIIGMNEFSPEDPSLVQFPGFSYAQINSYITVNEDGTIINNTLDPEENNETQKRAFYRPFVYDFAEGSFCNFILGDLTIKNNLKSKYPIYFNGGQLKKIFQAQPSPKVSDRSNVVLITTSSLNGGNVMQGTSYSVVGSLENVGTLYIGGSSLIGSLIFSPLSASVYNTDLFNDTFTGSLVGKSDEGLELNKVQQFITALGTLKKESTYKNNKRLFITACQSTTKANIDDTDGGNGRPLYLFESLGIPERRPIIAGELYGGSPADTTSFKGLGVTNIELPTLSTFEIETSAPVIINQSSNFKALRVLFNNRYFPKQTYYSQGELYLNGDPSNLQAIPNTPGFGRSLDENIDDGGVVLSMNDDDIPSILIPLKKERELPGGKGEKSFAIIPENLHPYIKDNLIFYLSKAGIDIGGSATDQVEENTSKKLGTKRILTEAQLRELARKRLEARLSRTRRGRRQLRQEERQNRREERREERRENRNERLKERNNRRENRRVNKENKKENRQENRQNRREKRKNRRRRR